MSVKAGTKRGRAAWEDCEDVDELKTLLNQQQTKLEKLSKENTELKRTIKAVEGNVGEDAAEDAEAMADKLRPSIVKQIEAQMVYKKQANTSRVSAEFPNLSLAEVRAIVGDELYDAASNGAKRLEVTADGDSLHSIFKDYGKGWQGAFVKTLRFGGTLNLIKGLKFTYDKADRQLKVSGSYSMSK